MFVDWKPCANARWLALNILASAADPPPPVDLNAWAEENLEFGQESPFPGKYDPSRFPFFRRPLEVLGPEHPARTIVFMKSAQLGGTVLAQIFLAASMDLDPGPFLYVHPTEGNAVRWVKTKLKPMLRGIKALARLFGAERSRDGGNSLLFLERRDGLGFIQVSGANSEASLSMISVSRQVQDDLAKWDLNSAGDPEIQADSRSKAFEWAKIFKCGTPLIADGCRITRNFEHSTQEHYEVPCPHCGGMQELTWYNMLACLDEQHPERAHFTCIHCQEPIEHRHKADMNMQGQWVARQPDASIIGFYLWAAYSPLETWQRIAEAWLAAKGDPAREQAFLNDTVGLAYQAAGEAPPWTGLRDRAGEFPIARGRIPPGALLLTIGVDVQGDRVEWQLVGWGRNLQRYVIDVDVIDGHITEAGCRLALDALLKRQWHDCFGQTRAADMLAIDAGNWQRDVIDWAKTHPQDRVIAVKGAKSDTAPDMVPVKNERLPNGKTIKYQRRFWMVGVSGMKMSLYAHLKKADPLERGFIHFCRGFEDEYFRQLTSERRTPTRRRDGFVEWHWTKDSSTRNEALDTMNYAEAAAIRCGLKRMLPEDFDRLAGEREVMPAGSQSDLFDPDQARAAKVTAETANAVRAEPTITVTPPASGCGAKGSGGWLKNQGRGGWLRGNR